MAKRPPRRRTTKRKRSGGAKARRRRSTKRQAAAKRVQHRVIRRAKPAKPSKRRSRKPRKQASSSEVPTKVPRIDRVRRTLDETVPTPPSSLNLNRRGSAARTGRAEIAESLQEHASMSPAITGGDVDVDLENAYFSGDEAPGGDNPTPDQDIVDDIGKALGLQYQDDEELKPADKVSSRDKHRWELDPASSEDYKDRK
jgi:hypothetical protein